MAKARIPKSPTTDPSVTARANTASAVPLTTEAKGNGSPAVKSLQKKTTGKPEIVKTESRPNLVPINLDDEVRRLAYLMAERRGFEPGHESEDWLAAEREVRQRYHQQSA